MLVTHFLRCLQPYQVEQEAELERIAADLAVLVRERTAEAARVAALEAESAAVHQAKLSLVAQEKARVAREKALRRKVASVRLMKQCWPGMVEGASAQLEAVGAWCSPAVWEVRQDFLPWVYEGVGAALGRAAVAGAVLDALLRDAVEHHHEVSAAACAARADEAARQLAARRAATKVRVFLDGASLGLEADAVVGPVDVSGGDTIADVEASIERWLQAEGLAVALPEGGLLRLAVNGRELPRGAFLLDQGIGSGAKLEVVLPALNGP